MARLNEKGHENKGSGIGRKLGNCSTLTNEEKMKKLGVGMGKVIKLEMQQDKENAYKAE
jgi:hypothetical protein